MTFTLTARGDPRPKEIEEGPTVIIVRENIRQYSETHDGETVTGYEWMETRFTPEEAEQARRDGLGGRASRLLYLHARLEETDYVALKIAEATGLEADALREQYADVIAQRKQWREEI